MDKHERDLARLQKAWFHIEYEFNTAVAAWRRSWQTNDPLLANALYESALLHTRNLIEFFFGRRRGESWGTRHPRDITPRDFLDDWEPPTSESAQRLKQSLETIDKHLSHLSWMRVDWSLKAEAVPWDYPELAEDLMAVMDDFKRRLREAEKS